jgi:hypothetical protein
MRLTCLEMLIVASIIISGRILPAVVFDSVFERPSSGLLPRLEHSPDCPEGHSARAIYPRFLGLWWARFYHIYIPDLLLRESLFRREVRWWSPSMYIG